MKRENFYRRNPSKALSGMVGLSLEERGVYNTVLDLLYSNWLPLEDDRAFIAGWCGCAVQKINPIIQRLIDKERLITFKEGARTYLSDAAFEAERKDVKGPTKTRSGRAGVEEKSGEVGQKSAGVEENPPLLGIDVEEIQHDTALEKSREEKIEGTNVPSNECEKPVKGKAKRRSPETEIPEGYPDASAQASAQARLREAGVNIAADLQAERFRNHALQTERRCRDWAAAWRNWIIGVIEKTPKSAVVAPLFAVAQTAPLSTFPGPAALRASVVEVADESFAVKFIDPAGWRAEDRTLIARNAYAAAEISRDLRQWLVRMNVRLEIAGQSNEGRAA